MSISKYSISYLHTEKAFTRNKIDLLLFLKFEICIFSIVILFSPKNISAGIVVFARFFDESKFRCYMRLLNKYNKNNCFLYTVPVLGMNVII